MPPVTPVTTVADVVHEQADSRPGIGNPVLTPRQRFMLAYTVGPIVHAAAATVKNCMSNVGDDWGNYLPGANIGDIPIAKGPFAAIFVPKANAGASPIGVDVTINAGAAGVLLTQFSVALKNDDAATDVSGVLYVFYNNTGAP